MKKNFPKKWFYNLLKDKHVNDIDYEYAIKVWNQFGMKDMGECHNLYLKTDICYWQT